MGEERGRPPQVVAADLLIESRFEVVFVFAAFQVAGGVSAKPAGG